MGMLALSIQQPWAWAILHAGKDVENRSWPTSVRGRVLIHASQKIDLDGFDYIEECCGIKVPPFPSTGGIVGSVEIVNCVQHSSSKWFQGKYGFVLRNPTETQFVRCPGRLKFFETKNALVPDLAKISTGNKKRT
ncbi:MAG: ASCH domain-containing protein [Chitinispirillaceae bacterium]|nr:ASCH domain-containing protein [Chitinispirillaceae bacterium]